MVGLYHLRKQIGAHAHLPLDNVSWQTAANFRVQRFRRLSESLCRAGGSTGMPLRGVSDGKDPQG
jgi:hypothetical protein